MRINKYFAFFLSLVLCACMVSFPVQASSSNAEDCMLSYDQCQSIISKVDASKDVCRVDIGNGLAVAFCHSKTSSTRSVASDTYSGYYYLIESGEKVAVFSFSASFVYNGSSVYYSSSTATARAVKDNWSIQYSRTHDDSQTVLSTASCVFTLYKNGSYNNSNTVTISCNKSGTTSVVSN